MKDLQKPGHVSLITLISRLREGRFVIPNFQRDFEWQPWDINALLRSIFLDYYIGSLLLWKGQKENFSALSCTPLHGFRESNEASREYIVLDGQQRLTALYYACMAPDIAAPKRKNRFIYFVRVDRFMEENYEEAFDYNWTQSGVRTLNDELAQYKQHLFPLAVLGKSGFSLPFWVLGYQRYWEQREAELEEQGDAEAAKMAKRRVADAEAFGAHLKGITEQYQVAYIELDSDLAIDRVCDIFTQINSRGVRLDVFDLMNALLVPKGLELKKMWHEAQADLDFVDTERMNVYILQVMSILRQAYCSPKYLYYLLPGQERRVRDADGSLRKEVLVPDTTDFRNRWGKAVEALRKAIDLLRSPQEFGAISSNYLPYVSILPAFASLHVAASSLIPAKQLDAKRKINHWYWASVFMNRYSGSVESTAARDYLDVKAWFEDSSAEPGLVAEFRERFRNLDLRRETKRGTSVYNGIFNLLVLRGARDWMTGHAPQYGDLDDHHVVPKDWAKGKQLSTSIDSILNRTPLTADTNRNVVNSRLPNEYLPDLIAETGEPAVRAILESHFISPAAFKTLLKDPFTPEDYEAFVAERQRTLQQAIEDLLIKARLDLSPRLRELDAQVERVELALRAAIIEALDRMVSEVPPHVRQRIEERVQTAAKKNPALDQDHYATLAGMLEYADLRELEQVITNKLSWGRFESRFGSKQTLAKRFDQLAELRNGIRHSRAVSEVTRKEGEAALLWFEEVLKEFDRAEAVEVSRGEGVDVSEASSGTGSLEESATTAGNKLTGKKLTQLKFWTSFRAYLEEQGDRVRPRRPRPQHWMSMAIGRAGFGLTAVASFFDSEASSYDSHEVRVGLWIGRRFSAAAFPQLWADRAKIEIELGYPVSWRQPTDEKRGRLFMRKSVADLSDERLWPELHDWLLRHLEDFHRVLGPRIRALELPTKEED